MPLRRVFVRGGHVLHAEGMDLFDEAGTPVETPLVQRQARIDAIWRWQVIVTLMLAGQRLTGSGKVVQL